MKSASGASKRHRTASPDPAQDADVEEEIQQSPHPLEQPSRPSSTSPERPPTVFEDDVQELTQARGLSRPPPAGYRMERNDRRGGEEWGMQYSTAYGHSPGGPYRGSSSRPWSPPYGGMRDYDGRPIQYGGRGALYDGRPEYSDRRDPYFDQRGRDFDRLGRQYEEGQRYEDGRYERHGPPADIYGSAAAISGGSEYPNTRRVGTSPAPSSSGIIENEVKSLVKVKRPLHVDKFGDPTGAMATLFNGDINAFVKDMDPRVGWEAQTKEARQRLIGRLLADYDVQGESSRVSEKYIKKQAGAALTQYRFSLNQYIDKGCDRPSGFNKTVWDDMVEKRKSKEGKEMSERMASIARGRGSRGTTKKAVRESVIVFLTRHLNRDPYQTEIEEAFEKEWNAIHEEQVEKKKLKTTGAAVVVGSAATYDILKRLSIVESFMQKWGPDLEVWKKERRVPLKQVTAPNRVIPKSPAPNELPIVLAGEDEDDVDAVEERKGTMSSDESDDSEKSKSHDREDEDVSVAKSQSDEEAETPDDMGVDGVVESDEGVKEIVKKKKAVAAACNLKEKPEAVTQEKAACDVGSVKVTFDVPTTQKKGKAVGGLKQSTRNVEASAGLSSENKDGSMASSKEKASTQRLLKRQKTEGNDVAQPVVLEDDEERRTTKTLEEAVKNAKPTRRSVKSIDNKVQKSGKKLK